MSSDVHRLWEIAFNFVNYIARILIGWFQLQKFSVKLCIWAEWRKKRKSKIAQFYKSKQHFKFFKSSYFCFPNLYLCEYLSKPFIRITTVKGVTTIEGIETMFCLWSFLIIFTKQPTSSGLKIQKWLD